MNETQPASPSIDLGELPLDAVNFILETINLNPLNRPVMVVAKLISTIQERTQESLNALDAAAKAANGKGKSPKKTVLNDAALAGAGESQKDPLNT